MQGSRDSVTCNVLYNGRRGSKGLEKEKRKKKASATARARERQSEEGVWIDFGRVCALLQSPPTCGETAARVHRYLVCTPVGT